MLRFAGAALPPPVEQRLPLTMYVPAPAKQPACYINAMAAFPTLARAAAFTGRPRRRPRRPGRALRRDHSRRRQPSSDLRRRRVGADPHVGSPRRRHGRGRVRPVCTATACAKPRARLLKCRRPAGLKDRPKRTWAIFSECAAQTHVLSAGLRNVDGQLRAGPSLEHSVLTTQCSVKAYMMHRMPEGRASTRCLKRIQNQAGMKAMQRQLQGVSCEHLRCALAV